MGNYFTLKQVSSYNYRRHYQPPENNFGGGRGGKEGRADILVLESFAINGIISPHQLNMRFFERYLGVTMQAKNDGWCSEKLRNPKNLYGGKTCPLESLLSKYNASLVDGFFRLAESMFFSSFFPIAEPTAGEWIEGIRSVS